MNLGELRPVLLQLEREPGSLRAQVESALLRKARMRGFADGSSKHSCIESGVMENMRPYAACVIKLD